MTKQDTIAEDLKRHPGLAPILEVDSRGNVVCLGWVSPVYEFNKEFLDNLGEESQR